MADWIPILATDVVNALQAPELDALRTAALADTQGDPINAAIATVTPRIRGYVASRPGNKIDLDATLIPPELIQDGVWIVIEALKVRLGDAVPFSDAQKTLLRRAEDDLQRVALGTLRISKPQNPEVDSSFQGGGGAEIAAGRTRLFGDMSGYAGQAQLNTLDGLGITDGVSTNGHYVDPPWLVSFPWQWLSNKPTTAAAAGIGDAVVTTGGYSDPGWLTLSIAKVTGLAGALAACLTTTAAASTYLTQANASSTYLTIANAASTYATPASIASTYLSQANAASTYLTIANAASTYLTTATAASTYLTIANAVSTYATIASPSHTGGMTLAYGTATTALSPLTITQTWNNVSVAFPGVVYNFTDSFSLAGSLMLDLQISGASKFHVDKSGAIYTVTNGLVSAPSIVFGGRGANWGLYSSGASSLSFAMAGVQTHQFWSDGSLYLDGSSHVSELKLPISGFFDFNADTYLYRFAAGIFAQRNGTNAQGHRIYNTWNGTNDEFLTIDFTTSANIATIGTGVAGTGTLRDLRFTGNNIEYRAAGSSRHYFFINAVGKWQIDANGHWSNYTDGTADIGSGAGSNRVRSGYFSTSVQITGAASSLVVSNSAYTNGTDFENAVISWSSNICSIGVTKGGAGIGRGLNIVCPSDITFLANAAGPSVKSANGNFQPNSSSNPALTGNFVCITATAGAPSGTPTGTLTNCAPIHYDTTGKKLYIWDTAASAWKQTVALT